MAKSLIHVYTGNGKGKTTAALGLSLRAVGQGMRVSIIQFLKTGKNSGEVNVIEKISKLMNNQIEINCFGSGNFISKATLTDLDKSLANRGMIAANNAMKGNLDVLVLDEFCCVLDLGLISKEDALDLIAARNMNSELILTGRNAPDYLCGMADIVTEMKEIKHSFNTGLAARKGIEY